MPFLAAWLLSVFTNVATWFLQFLSRRFAIVAAVTTVIVGMTVALSLLLKSFLLSISVYANTLFPPSFVIGFASVMPENFEACIALMASTRISIWAYNFNKDLLKMYLGGI
ncbi:DUF5455 family protein [Pseudomonas alloputida]|uniref:DUF5455 family protein n=1 Tax=Pseudomonas alloputida TaxID=1940621 RepID=UPI003B428B81